jgi:hypothetical protein
MGTLHEDLCLFLHNKSDRVEDVHYYGYYDYFD